MTAGDRQTGRGVVTVVVILLSQVNIKKKTKMSSSSASAAAGANVMSSLKAKMQTLREELEKHKDMYEAKCKEVDREASTRDEVSSGLLS